MGATGGFQGYGFCATRLIGTQLTGYGSYWWVSGVWLLCHSLDWYTVNRVWEVLEGFMGMASVPLA